MNLRDLFGKTWDIRSGPVAWCTTCHRKHPRREHPATFKRVERTTPSGQKRMHWAHVPETKSRRKMRVRKT